MKGNVVLLIILLATESVLIHCGSLRDNNKKLNGVSYSQLTPEQIVKFDISLLNQDCKEKSEFLDALNARLETQKETLKNLNHNFEILQEVQDKLFLIETSLSVTVLIQNKKKAKQNLSVPVSDIYDEKALEIVKSLNENLLLIDQLQGEEKAGLIDKINNQIRNLRSGLIFQQSNTSQLIEELENKRTELNDKLKC